jgi:hypothetical protein
VAIESSAARQRERVASEWGFLVRWRFEGEPLEAEEALDEVHRSSAEATNEHTRETTLETPTVEEKLAQGEIQRLGDRLVTARNEIDERLIEKRNELDQGGGVARNGCSRERSGVRDGIGEKSPQTLQWRENSSRIDRRDLVLCPREELLECTSQ